MTSIKIHIMHTGSVIVDEALPYSNRRTHPLSWTGLFRSKKHRIKLPVSTYLIEHPKGLVLVDTGWHTDNRQHQLRNLKFQYFVNKAVLPPGKAIHEQLAERGVKPEDLDIVLLSHLHCDHADGLRHVRNAKKILVSEQEWEAANHNKIIYLSHEWTGVPIETFKFVESDLGPKRKSYDIFGDGTMEMIWAPGHSAGLSALKVTHPDSGKFVLLAADVGYSKESWLNHDLPGVVDNKEDLNQSLDWVKNISDNPQCIDVIANHDMEVKPHTINL